MYIAEQLMSVAQTERDPVLQEHPSSPPATADGAEFTAVFAQQTSQPEEGRGVNVKEVESGESSQGCGPENGAEVANGSETQDGQTKEGSVDIVNAVNEGHASVPNGLANRAAGRPPQIISPVPLPQKPAGAVAKATPEVAQVEAGKAAGVQARTPGTSAALAQASPSKLPQASRVTAPAGTLAARPPAGEAVSTRALSQTRHATRGGADRTSGRLTDPQLQSSENPEPARQGKGGGVNQAVAVSVAAQSASKEGPIARDLAGETPTTNSDRSAAPTSSAPTTGLAAGEVTNTAEPTRTPTPADLPPLPRAVHVSNMAQSLMEGVRMHSAGGPSRLRIRLSPPDLGSIDVRLTMRDGKVEAVIQVERSVVVEQLERAVPSIRETLEQDGINLSKFDIHSQDRPQQQAHDAGDPNRPDRHAVVMDPDAAPDPGIAVGADLAPPLSHSLIDYFA